MAAITPLTENDLEALLSRYSLRGLRSFWPASNGIENSNYFIRLAGELAGEDGARELVLTLLEHPGHAGDLLVPLLDLCDAAGLPVARVIRNTAGNANDEINGKPTILSPRLAGQHVINPTLQQCESVGQFLARFHIVAADPMPAAAAEYPRDADWLAQTASTVHAELRFADNRLLDAALTTVTSLLNRSDAASLPRGIIHGDLFRDNVLFTEHGLSGVLDFHHAATGSWVYDVAVAANDWCSVDDGALDGERVMSLLRSYHSVRPLKLPELWFFPVFALYAALAFWLSRLDGQRTAGEHGRTKNPDEFRRIVQAHMNKFFYLDPRLLH